MKRRDFISLLGGAAMGGVVSPATAQSTDRLRRVAILYGGSAAVDQSLVTAFRNQLEELGWISDRTVHFELRWGEGNAEKIRSHAAELVGWSPDLIFVYTNLALAAIKPLAGRIPIIFAGVGDPVGSGFVASLSRPGGNITGFESYVSSMGGKWLETLRAAVPRVTRVIAIFHPETKANQDTWQSIQDAASRLGVQVTAGGVHDAAEIEAMLSSFAAKPNGGVIVLPHAVTISNYALIVALELKYKLPSVHPQYEESLITYGLDWEDIMKRSAGYVDRVLRGANPADLPIQAPSKFILIINTRFAQAIGVDVPTSILLHADKVIE